jgi:hypothetical protein
MSERYGVILSGAISDTLAYRARFAEAAHEARKRWPGRKVWNPALLPPDRDERWYMRQCLQAILDAPQDATVVMLPMWELSAGAIAERAVALKLGLEVVELDETAR